MADSAVMVAVFHDSNSLLPNLKPSAAFLLRHVKVHASKVLGISVIGARGSRNKLDVRWFKPASRPT
jgi:hypothetical protein